MDEAIRQRERERAIDESLCQCAAGLSIYRVRSAIFSNIVHMLMHQSGRAEKNRTRRMFMATQSCAIAQPFPCAWEHGG
jgi:hypothetical protein